MHSQDLTPAALDAAEREIGDGAVVMVNLLRFRDEPIYPLGFPDAKPSSRSAYYEGYVGAFRAASEEVGVASTLLYVGSQVFGLLTGADDQWDDIAVVRYESFADLRKIMESEAYKRNANPHRVAAIADWRFVATRGR